MPGLLAGTQGMTFNLPQFTGRLFSLTPSDTPFLSSIGGLQGGGDMIQNKIFEWQAYDLREPENPGNLEGQDAPGGRLRTRTNVTNVAQIFHDTVDVSYTRQAAIGQRDGVIGAGDPVVNDERRWQLDRVMEQLARDVEFCFIRGTFANPADNATPRKTRGILEAITTNVTVKSVDGTTGLPNTVLTENDVLNLMQDVWESGGMQSSESATLMCSGTVKRQLSTIFITNKGYAEETRTVGGVNVQTIETDFGRLNVMLNRYMPADQLAVISLEVCEPRILFIPGKGFMFEEPLAKTGASEKVQVYGEIGLAYGAEIQHGKITNIAAA